MVNSSPAKIKSALIETGSIVLGVLIALGASEWNDNRLDLERERQIVDQIARDLEVDIENLTYSITGLQSKEASLLRLRDGFKNGSINTNGRQMLEDMVIGPLDRVEYSLDVVIRHVLVKQIAH